MRTTATQKSQGLSFNTIVLAIIALIILVIIVLFVTGGFAKFSKGFRTTETTTTEDAKNECRILCNRAQTSSEKLEDFAISSYCAKTFAIDKDLDGQIEPGEDRVKCSEVPISISCSATIQTTGVSCSPGCKPNPTLDNCEVDSATSTAVACPTSNPPCLPQCKIDTNGKCVPKDATACGAEKQLALVTKVATPTDCRVV